MKGPTWPFGYRTDEGMECDECGATWTQARAIGLTIATYCPNCGYAMSEEFVTHKNPSDGIWLEPFEPLKMFSLGIIMNEIRENGGDTDADPTFNIGLNF